MGTYVGHYRAFLTGGRVVGQSDDHLCIQSEDPERALDELLSWARERWPESDSPYEAVVWLESGGDVIAQREITVDGRSACDCCGERRPIMLAQPGSPLELCLDCMAAELGVTPVDILSRRHME